MTENTVTIKNNKYRYKYDPESQETKYFGPVGSSPPLTEQEFLKAFGRKGEEIYQMTIREGKGQWVPNFRGKQQLYEYRLIVLDLRPWGGTQPSDVIRLVNKAGYQNFTIAPTPDGNWEFIVKEWRWT